MMIINLLILFMDIIYSLILYTFQWRYMEQLFTLIIYMNNVLQIFVSKLNIHLSRILKNNDTISVQWESN